MNPLASTKYAKRLLMAMATVASILLAAGCGASNVFVKPLGGNFTDASLSGQYVMKQTGLGLNSVGNLEPFSETSVFMADGKGHLTITVDDEQQGGPIGPGLENLAGTYGIAGDGTGLLTFDYPAPGSPSNYQITMIDDSHFYLIEGDTYATSSGYGVIQTATPPFSPNTPSGTFAFKAHNSGVSSRVGAITITAGSISGSEDLIVIGSAPASLTLTGSMTAPDSNGRGSFTLNDGSSFNYYVVSPSEFYFMSNSSSLEVGQAEAQTTTSLSPGSYVFGSRGDTFATGPLGIHSAGVFTTDGVSSISAGTVDYVQDQNVYSDATVSSSSTLTLAANGRGTTTLLLSGAPTVSQIFWVINGSTAYFITDNTSAAEDGTFTIQSGTIGLSSQAAFVMDGFPGIPPLEADQVGVFAPTTGGNFNWKEENNQEGSVGAIGTNGTFGTISPNGRVTVTVNGITGTSSLVFYLSSVNTGFMVEEDESGGVVNNIGGVFATQATQ